MLRMRARLTGFIEPCLPSPAPNPPAGDGWIHEIKLDGFRMLARRDGAGVRLLTRRGIDWTTRYPSIAAAVAAFDVLANGIVVGRIFKANAAPVGSPWLWTLAFGHHEDRTPTHGYAATREAAMAAFAKSWRRA